MQTTQKHHQDLLKAALDYLDYGLIVVLLYTISKLGTCSCGKDDCSHPGKLRHVCHGDRMLFALPWLLAAANREDQASEAAANELTRNLAES